MNSPSRQTFITTASGKKFYPLEPRVEDVDIIDIAHALSHQCRYSGHTRVHYSVAEHSVRVARLLQDWGANRYTQLWGLLHDASEAYLVDLPTPLKQNQDFAATYREAEDRLQAVICKRYGLAYEQPSIVKTADVTMLATEIRDVMHPDMDPWSELPEPPTEERVTPWAHVAARVEFLKTFRALTER